MNDSWLRWFIPVMIVSILFFGCGERKGEKQYHEALAQWAAGNPIRAQALLEQSISRRAGSAKNADAYNRLGLLLWEMGDVNASINAFRESLQIIENDYAVTCNLGVALSATPDIAGAERAFRDAALLQPGDPRPLAYAGIVFAQNQKWSEAASHLQRALDRTPNNPKIETALALAELHLHGAKPALKRLQNILQADPGFAPALFNIAAIYRYWEKKPDEATRWYERYLQHAAGTDAFAASARLQLQAIDNPVGTPTLRYTPPTERNRKQAELHFQRALTDHRGGNTAAAIKSYISAIEADDSYDRAFYNLGLAYYANGQMELAGDAFARAVKLNSAFVDARYNLALVNHYHLGQTPKALADLNIILAQQPSYQPAMDLITRIQGRP